MDCEPHIAPEIPLKYGKITLVRSLLFDDSLDKTAPAQLFQHPIRTITAHRATEVDDALEQIEQATAQGFYCAGFFAYELGYCLESKLAHLLPKNLTQPLLYFGVFEDKQELDEIQTGSWLEGQSKQNSSSPSKPRNFSPLQFSPSQFSMQAEDYKKRFLQVKDYISAGDIYQLNLTFKAHFSLKGCPYQFYRAMRQNQEVHYGAFIDAKDFTIISFSPEQFFTLKAGTITTRPMKGTMKRGTTQAEDKKLCQTLFEDEKNRAENLMIVDLMRNDLSRIARAGSVRVEELYKIEKYKTLFQMTSLVSAQIDDDIPLKTFIKSLFPAGSIIGAPKLRAQEIIRQLEPTPRGVYTGSIGYFSPHKEACFNVAIRTLFLDANQNGEIGIGSGVVSDSEAISEYDECLLKMAFLDPLAKPHL